MLLLGGNQSELPFDPTLPNLVRYSWYPKVAPPPMAGGLLYLKSS